MTSPGDADGTAALPTAAVRAQEHVSLEIDALGVPDPQLESYVLRLLDECRDEVRMADSKTSMLFAATATVIAIITNILLDDTSELRTSGDSVVVLSVIVLLMFATALVFLALAVIPRIGRPESGQARYFEEHAQFDDPVALLQVITRDAEHPATRHAQQVHALARIVRRKYQHLRRAMQTISLAMLALSVVALVGAIQ